MRFLRIGLAVAAAAVAAGCDKETGPFFAPEVPLAYVRYVNAVPDTFALDFRFIDQLEYSPNAILLGFRSFTPYQGAAPGTRPLRVFTNPGGLYPDINIVSQVLADESITLTAGTYYTIVMAGFARPGQTPGLDLMVIEDQIPADIGSNVAVRAVHLGSGLANIDVFAASASGDPLPATPTFTNLGFGSLSTYTTFAPGTKHFRVTDAGTTNVVASANAPNGAAGDPDNFLTTIGGVQQAGSAITAFFFPRSVAGSPASNSPNPSIVYVVDRHPR